MGQNEVVARSIYDPSFSVDSCTKFRTTTVGLVLYLARPTSRFRRTETIVSLEANLLFRSNNICLLQTVKEIQRDERQIVLYWGADKSLARLNYVLYWGADKSLARQNYVLYWGADKSLARPNYVLYWGADNSLARPNYVLYWGADKSLARPNYVLYWVC